MNVVLVHAIITISGFIAMGVGSYYLAPKKKKKTTTAKSYDLYRHYNDNGELLYIGISINAFSRYSQHKKRKFHKEIALMKIQKCSSREEALRLEKKAIIREKPIHNVVHNKDNTKTSNLVYWFLGISIITCCGYLVWLEYIK